MGLSSCAYAEREITSEDPLNPNWIGQRVLGVLRRIAQKVNSKSNFSQLFFHCFSNNFSSQRLNENKIQQIQSTKLVVSYVLIFLTHTIM